MYAWKDAHGAIRQRFVAKTPEDLRAITREHGESDAGLEAVRVIPSREDDEILVESSEDAQP